MRFQLERCTEFALETLVRPSCRGEKPLAIKSKLK